MKQYRSLIETIMNHGEFRQERTGTGAKSVFGKMYEYDLKKGFPLVTLKGMEHNFPIIKHELEFFLKGETNLSFLLDRKVRVWNADAYRAYKAKGGLLSEVEFIERVKSDASFAKEHGDLGAIYGKQWRSWGSEGFDQLMDVIRQIKENPTSRRMIVSAWNVTEMSNMVLPPCHVLFQFYVNSDGLSLMMYQRSADSFLGVPFNIASYALLTHIIAKHCGLEVDRFIHTIGDAHIYSNHFEQCEQMLSNNEKELCNLVIEDSCKDIDNIDWSKVYITDYSGHQVIRGKISVG